MNNDFDKASWIAKLESIRKKRILSYKQMAQSIGIGYNTLCIFMDEHEMRTTYPSTIRKIDKYIKFHEAREQ